MTTGLPATVRTPTRGISHPGCDATLTGTTPLPLWLSPATLTHSLPLIALHEQPAVVETLTDSVAPARGTTATGAMSYRHSAPPPPPPAMRLTRPFRSTT